MKTLLSYVNSWQSVSIVGIVSALVGAIFYFADADGKAALLGVLCVLGTTAAAIARQAFAVPPAAAPKRINMSAPPPADRAQIERVLRDALQAPNGKCPECKQWPDINGHSPGCTRDEDDDDPGEGGEVLADGPPTVPQRRSDMHKTMLAVPVALALRVGVALSVMLLSACSPSALQTHATIASITGHVFDAACAEVETARSREQHAIADGPLDREAAVAAVDAVRAHWAPALASCELAADTHDAWVTALALAAAGAPFTLADGIALAERALDVWRSLTATLATAGVEMPPLPAELVALTGGAL